MSIVLPAPAINRLRANITAARTDLLCCIASMAALGASVPVTRTLLAYPPAAGQAMRYGLAAVVLAPVAWQARRDRPPVRRADWLRLAAAAVAGLAAFNFLLLGALRHAEPAAVAAVLGCAPIVFALAAPLLRRRAPALRIVAGAAIVVAGTLCLNGFGRLSAAGLLLAAVALAADIAFSLLAAPLIPRLGAITVAAAACAISVPMFLGAALVTGEIGRWRAPQPSESGAVVFLAVVLTAGMFVTWCRGLRHIGPACAGLAMGAVPVTALAVACLQAGALPSSLQFTGIAAVIVGMAAAPAVSLSPAVKIRYLRGGSYGVVMLLIAAGLGCAPHRQDPPAPRPDQPVRAYFTALESADYQTASALSRSASAWLATGGLAAGYQPPTGHQILRVEHPADSGTGHLVYVRVRYLLGGLPAESSVEVWRNRDGAPWSINSGSTGRLDVVAPTCPRLRIAGVSVDTLLRSPRVSGGQPAGGFFELPPGVYTVEGIGGSGCLAQPIQVAVAAAWRGGTPVSVTVDAPLAVSGYGLPAASGRCVQVQPRVLTPLWAVGR